ncbi:hypothetical protein D0T53_11020 [Dysgonomonas sp. 216]|uniref:hypothetical protein n=1 Tax=Dysgonomonas sp. 216 TaxID=2302934 RepID=UPI0013D5B124|nr:hypothetical protein [Dysgonomonas sp. 216]NDW19436.1 hypothetical protein [Dysgonomonas sp. 216]
MRTLQLSDQKARSLYKTGSNEMKELLAENFGKDFFSQSVIDRIKTYEDVCAELGESPVDEVACKKLGMNKNDIAYLKLTQVVRALNEGWVAKVYDNEDRWYPWFYHNESPSAFAFDGSSYDRSYAAAGSGSRLCFKSSELADYAGKQFLDLWREFIV